MFVRIEDVVDVVINLDQVTHVYLRAAKDGRRKVAILMAHQTWPVFDGDLTTVAGRAANWWFGEANWSRAEYRGFEPLDIVAAYLLESGVDGGQP